MNKKVKKSLYLPVWIVKILDSEGQDYDGPGVVAAASIHSFSEMNKKGKISILQKFRDKEIRNAYVQDDDLGSVAAFEDENAIASAPKKPKRKSVKRRRAKSG